MPIATAIHVKCFACILIIENIILNYIHKSFVHCPSVICMVFRLISGAYTQRNLINSNRNHIVFTILRLIRNQTDDRLVPYHSENGKYNLISI